MTIVAIVGTKGGVGKTTLALNLAFSLARRGWRTLLADADPQGCVGLSLVGRAKEAPGLAQVATGALDPRDAVLRTRVPELHILPAGRFPVASQDESTLPLTDARQLRGWFELFEPPYDLVLIDCPAGLGGITRAVMRAATHFIAPLQAEPLSLRAVPRLLELLATLHAAGHAPAAAGFVLTMVHSRDAVSLECAQEAWRLLPGDLVPETVVPRDAVFLQASAKGIPVALLDRRPPPVALVFDRLAAELEPRLGLPTESIYDEPLPLLD